MPYESQAQSRYIHMKANEGTPWAKKFVSDAQHGEGSVKKLPEHKELGKSFGILAARRGRKAKRSAQVEEVE